MPAKTMLSQAAEMGFFLQCDTEVVGIFEGTGLAGGVGRLCKAISMLFLVQSDLWKVTPPS